MKTNPLFENRAQTSTELLIVLAAVIAVALLLVHTLNKTAKSASTTVDKNSIATIKQTNALKPK
ncbi:MAG: hypothetical protein J7K68_03055 [Candidatus Diapherotrites archaeon]|nr:hypothetical protein [Candidatus Diapherotrites archaeon]